MFAESAGAPWKLGWMPSLIKNESHSQKRLKLSMKTRLCDEQADCSHVWRESSRLKRLVPRPSVGIVPVGQFECTGRRKGMEGWLFPWLVLWTMDQSICDGVELTGFFGLPPWCSQRSLVGSACWASGIVESNSASAALQPGILWNVLHFWSGTE